MAVAIIVALTVGVLFELPPRYLVLGAVGAGIVFLLGH